MGASKNSIPMSRRGAAGSVLEQVRQCFTSEAQASKPIGHLLVIAGFSGAGKTTFMEQLAAGQLSRDIDWLVDEAKAWPQINNKHAAADLRELLDARTAPEQIPGLMLHYDMTVPLRCGWSSYEADPVLELVAFAERTSIVLIKPSLRRLRAQRRLQVFGGRSRLEPNLIFWRWWVRHTLVTGLERGMAEMLNRWTFARRKLKALKTVRKQPPKSMLAARELTFYRSRNGPALWLNRWEQYVRAAQAAHRVECILALRPSSGLYAQDAPVWQRTDA